MLFKNNQHCLNRTLKPLSLLALFLFTGSLAAMAAGKPAPSSLSNTLALTLITLMLVLLVIIFINKRCFLLLINIHHHPLPPFLHVLRSFKHLHFSKIQYLILAHRYVLSGDFQNESMYKNYSSTSFVMQLQSFWCPALTVGNPLRSLI